MDKTKLITKLSELSKNYRDSAMGCAKRADYSQAFRMALLAEGIEIAITIIKEVSQ